MATDSTAAPMRVSNPGTPDQTNLVPNSLQPNQQGPAFSFYSPRRPCSGVSEEYISSAPPSHRAPITHVGAGTP